MAEIQRREEEKREEKRRKEIAKLVCVCVCVSCIIQKHHLNRYSVILPSV